MSKILFLAHPQADGSLANVTREAVAAAQAIDQQLPGSTLTVGLFGGDVQAAVAALAGCGATTVLTVSGDAFATARYASDAAAMEALIKQSGADVVVAPATSRINRAAAGAAFRVGGRIDTHITGLQVEGGQLKARRWFYRQRMEGVMSRSQRPWVLLVESGIAAAWQGATGAASATAVAVPVGDDATRTTVDGIQAPASDAQTIRPDAKLLFVAGAGWTKKQADGQPHVEDAAVLIKDFLGRSKSSLGSSKSLVDLKTEGQQTLSFMSHLNQVGQTGSTPRHPKGLATCCHGEEPHVVGWRFINERRAVNLDPNCGWAQGKADVLYVADAFAVMTKLNALIG